MLYLALKLGHTGKFTSSIIILAKQVNAKALRTRITFSALLQPETHVFRLTDKQVQVTCGPSRRGGRAVECTGLENRRRLIAYREFESHLLRQLTTFNKTPTLVQKQKKRFLALFL
jgi:hypothetical protein